MPTVNFTLRDPGRRSPRPINLIARHKGEKLVYGTGLSVLAKHWDSNRQRVRNVTDEPNRDLINQRLDGLQASMNRVFARLIAGGVAISKSLLRLELEYELGEAKRPGDETLFQFIERFISQGGNGVSKETVKRYSSALNHLKAFEKSRKAKVDFESVNQAFYNDLIDFLSEKQGLALNTVGLYVKNLKVFLRAAYDQEVTDRKDFEKRWFKVPKEETDHIALKEDEIELLFALDLSESPRLDRVRDIFIVGCWTGCRFSDLEQVKSENIINGFLQVKQQKTGLRVAIPVHPMVTAILDKHNGILPASISNQKMNDYLKEVGKLAGLTEPVDRRITRGGMKQITSQPKYERLSSHTARRSFATNMYLDGLPSITIRAITGHKTESAFLSYIKLSPEDHARIIQKAWNENPATRMVRVAD